MTALNCASPVRLKYFATAASSPAVSDARQADRQDAPPKLTAIRYEIVVTTPENDARLDLLHRNILKYGTISNTLTAAVPLTGTIRRA